jgi:hypothetical protein
MLVKKYLRRCRRRTVRHRIKQCKCQGLFDEDELVIRKEVFYRMKVSILRKLTSLQQLPEMHKRSFFGNIEEAFNLDN